MIMQVGFWEGGGGGVKATHSDLISCMQIKAVIACDPRAPG